MYLKKYVIYIVNYVETLRIISSGLILKGQISCNVNSGRLISLQNFLCAILLVTVC